MAKVRSRGLAVALSLVLGLVLVLTVGAWSACSRRPPPGDEGSSQGRSGIAEPQAEPAGGTPRPPQTAGSPDACAAENAEAVDRYDDEATLGYAQATVVKSAIAHTATDGGRQVTLLVGGTGVEQVAERGGAILVTFPDPTDETKRAMGWIPTSAIRPLMPGPCPERQNVMVTALGSFCATPCREASDCTANEMCVQGGTATRRDGRITNLLHYCVAR
jgi:hypothetical protein